MLKFDPSKELLQNESNKKLQKREMCKRRKFAKVGDIFLSACHQGSHQNVVQELYQVFKNEIERKEFKSERS